MQETALPPDIEPATILGVVLVGHVFTHGEVEVLPVTVRLVGLHAGAADLGREEAGDGEGVVTHEFGIEAIRALAADFAVIRVGRSLRGCRHGTATIRFAVHDEADHVLQVPLGVDEFDGQPIQ